MLIHVASHGFVVIGPQLFEGPANSINATWVSGVDDWARKHLLDKLINEGINPEMTIDFDTQYLIGHSAGLPQYTN